MDNSVNPYSLENLGNSNQNIFPLRINTNPSAISFNHPQQFENSQNYQNEQNYQNASFISGNSRSIMSNNNNVIEACMAELQRSRQQNQMLVRYIQNHMMMNNNNKMNDDVESFVNSGSNLFNTNSTISRRKLPKGSPKVADKKKKRRKHKKHVRKRNQFIVEMAVKAGVFVLCESSHDNCPRKSNLCYKFHQEGYFKKHWFCKKCNAVGGYDNNAQIVRHLNTDAHSEDNSTRSVHPETDKITSRGIFSKEKMLPV